jgi:choline-sulfatase
VRKARRAGRALALALPLIGALVYLIAYVVRPVGTHIEPRAAAARHVLLITIDTLRADRLGSYGHAAARTPTLDALARRGTRFSHAYATAPITLASHASMMTGRYPPGHGARHNGIAMRNDVPTLAEAFRRATFETGAFVSAFPLDKRFGLVRGFNVYDDELPRREDGRHATERAGAATVDRAIAWMRARPATARIFAWVHLFEPHAPYGTPDEARARDASSRYDDEIAIADREIGRLVDAWRDLPDTLVVATADHGEAFGEHGEIGHSIFVYDTTLQVPMILAGPGVPIAVVDEPVTVADIAPTLAAFGALPPVGEDGMDLRPIVAGQGAGGRALYAESFAPLVDFGWAALRSMRQDGVKLIAAPRPELYDLRADVREERNIVGERAALASELAARVDQISGPILPPRQAPIDADALARLRSLGYASGGGASNGSRIDPKDRIEIAALMASVTSGELHGAAAERALRDVVRQDPQNPQARQRLGFVLAESGRCAEAERHFASAIFNRLPSADPYLGLAMCRAQRGAASESLATLRDARLVEPGNPTVEANIGLMALQLGRLDDAIRALTDAVKIDPDLHEARFALARALAREGQREAALREATELLRRLPASASQRPEVERLVAALR